MKRYIMVVDEIGMALLSKVLLGVQFIELQGVAVEGKDYVVLVNPKEQPRDETK